MSRTHRKKIVRPSRRFPSTVKWLRTPKTTSEIRKNVALTFEGDFKELSNAPRIKKRKNLPTKYDNVHLSSIYEDYEIKTYHT